MLDLVDEGRAEVEDAEGGRRRGAQGEEGSFCLAFYAAEEGSDERQGTGVARYLEDVRGRRLG